MIIKFGGGVAGTGRSDNAFPMKCKGCGKSSNGMRDGIEICNKCRNQTKKSGSKQRYRQ